ncbi:MAG: type II toxin-antitoxin system VapC family toxin [Pseudomonadota bacterium]
MILLDTYALIWLDTADRRLGKKTRALVEREWALNQVAVSAITFWEAGMLAERRKIRLAAPVAEWRTRWVDAGLIELPLDGTVLVRSLDLGSLSADPADRFIAATALAVHAVLVSADEKILTWQHELARHDAST